MPHAAVSAALGLAGTLLAHVAEFPAAEADEPGLALGLGVRAQTQVAADDPAERTALHKVSALFAAVAHCDVLQSQLVRPAFVRVEIPGQLVFELLPLQLDLLLRLSLLRLLPSAGLPYLLQQVRGGRLETLRRVAELVEVALFADAAGDGLRL